MSESDFVSNLTRIPREVWQAIWIGGHDRVSRASRLIPDIPTVGHNFVRRLTHPSEMRPPDVETMPKLRTELIDVPVPGKGPSGLCLARPIPAITSLSDSRVNVALLGIPVLSALGSSGMLPRICSLLSSCLQWITRREARELRSRPGHVCLHRRRSLIKRVPWRSLATTPGAVAALLCATVFVAYLGTDPKMIGADARLLVKSENTRPDEPPVPEDSALRLEGEVALLLQVAMLQNSVARLDKVPHYTATFVKNERIGGDLLGEQVMQMKIHHNPHRVFFQVEVGDVGREILYPVSGTDARMLVKLPTLGFKLPALRLEPTSSRAMSEARYPITMAGIKELTKLAIEIRNRDLTLKDKIHAEACDNAEYEGRKCFSFTTTYKDSSVSKEYRKCVLYIDRQLMIPVLVKNFTWAESIKDADPSRLDDTTLLEYYAFKEIKLDAKLSEIAFSSENPEYRFK